MGKALVIVESPSKAKIINGYLGDDYVVRASVGHIRDLPSSSSKTGERKTPSRGGKKTEDEKRSDLFGRMGLDPLNHWKADYQIMPDKKAVVDELRKLAADCDEVYLATDLDREGEAIAWHLKELLTSSKHPQTFWRVKYPEITHQAIAKAFASPSQINMDLVNAQQTRRFLDRVVGYMLSPLLWVKVGRGLSAGRVQSVAVALIVDRERDIKSFIPEEYWSITADTLTPRKDPLQLTLTTFQKSKIHISNAQEAQLIVEELKKNPFIVAKIESKRGSTHAPAPFTTSTLQQTANQRLGFSVKRTMTVAQRLYESGFITYMRTDSVNLSQEAIDAARDIIKNEFGKDYLPEKPNVYQSKASAQEAHEAIRPSHPEVRALPASADRDQQKLYQLIFERYLACQMSNLVYETTSIVANSGDFALRATGRTEIFPGYTAAFSSNKSENTFLPIVHEGEELELKKLNPLQHFTQPPARYTEASLVKELEKDGIGRPSTYASIINTIQERGYIKLERNRFFATKMGEIVTDRLRFSFANLMDYNFTASMEQNLDEIAEGKRNWLDSLDQFYADFSSNLVQAQKPASEGGMPNNQVIPTDLPCPKCGKYNMGIQIAKTGTFLSCLGYHDPNVKAKDRCKCTINLLQIEEQPLPEGQEMDEAVEADRLLKSKRCPECGSTMDAFLIDKHNKLYICSNAPVCQGFIRESGDFSDSPALGPVIECEKCGHDMVLKDGRFGKYMLCTNEECKNTRKILKNGEVAPPTEDPVDLPEVPCKAEGAHYVLRHGAMGLFLAANTFPAVRETSHVTVSLLKRFRDRISPKFYYLADGPEKDPDGNVVEVRYSRKSKEQYLMSVNAEGKATNWMAFYQPESKSWNVFTSSKKSAGDSSEEGTDKKISTKKSTSKKSTTKKTSSKSTAKKTTTKKTTTKHTKSK